jgi:hypothetical protein
MFSVLHPITDLWDSGTDCGYKPLTAAPPRLPLDLKGQFKFEFNNYLRSALTLRGVSSLYISFGDKPRRASAPHPIDERAAAGCALDEMIRLSI